MMKWLVEHVQTWMVDAESEADALQIVQDGGGTAPTVDWYVERDFWAPGYKAPEAPDAS